MTEDGDIDGSTKGNRSEFNRGQHGRLMTEDMFVFKDPFDP